MANINFLNNIDLNKNQVLNLLLQMIAGDHGTPVEGLVWYDSSNHCIKYYNGTTIKTVTISTDLSNFITLSSSGALTNKTFDANGTGNGITNIELADFASGQIETTLTGSATALTRSDGIKTYIDGAVEGRKWGVSVKCATTGAGTLASSFENGDMVDGYTLVTNDRILIKNQADDKENGVYKVKASGAPGRDETVLTQANHQFFVEQGTSLHDTTWVCTNDTITFGVTSIAFSQSSATTVSDASTSTKGILYLATQVEAEAKSDTGKAVVAADLVNFPIKKVFDVGDNSNTTLTMNHALATKDVQVFVYDKSSPYSQVFPEVQMYDTNNVKLVFAIAPTLNQYRCVIIG